MELVEYRVSGTEEKLEELDQNIWYFKTQSKP
jgi:hypothetical protein